MTEGTKVKQAPDPWQRTTTENGFPADEVISALQKCIRRGLTENAVLLGWEMFITSPELEAKMWARLQVISVEDVGFGNPQAPILIEALFRMHERIERPQHDRFLFAAHAIRTLSLGEKDRTTDDMVNWAKHNVAFGERLPEIPDFAVDMHTGRGEALGRDYRYFMEVASQVSPESKTKETKYREWILAALDAGKLT